VHSLAEVENSEVKVVSQSWPKSLSQPARSALVVLCKRPSNNAIDRSAQRRRRWVPSSLRSSAPGHCER
jgi:hypothetical protein